MPELTDEQLAALLAGSNYIGTKPAPTPEGGPPPPHKEPQDQHDELDGILGFVDAVFSFVWQAIEDAAGWILDFIDSITAWVERRANALFQSVWDALGTLIDWVVQGIRNAVDYISTQIGIVWGWASDAIDWIADKGQWLIDQVEAGANAVADAVWSMIEDIGSWIYDHLLVPVWNWIADAASNIWDDLFHPIFDLIQSVINDAWGALTDFINGLIDAALDGIGLAGDILDVITKALSWLVWFGEHTLGDLGDLITEGFDLSATGVRDLILGSLDAHGDDVEAFVASFIDG